MRNFLKNATGSLLIFTLFIIFPVVVFFSSMLWNACNNPYAKFWSENELRYVLLFAGILLISFILVAIYLQINRGAWRALKIQIHKIIIPLIWGAILGVFLSVCYLILLILLDKTDFDSIWATVIGIYFTSCGIFIGLYGIFKEKAPILDIRDLMDYLINDMSKCERLFFWAYPGLSFGSLTVGGKRYEDFHQTLDTLIQETPCEKHFLILSEKEIKKFYKPYYELIELENNPVTEKRILKSIEQSKTFISRITDHESQHWKGSFKWDFTIPNYPNQIIIIDSFIYILNPVGLPMRINDEYIFTLPIDKQSPVDFIAIRISDIHLAKLLFDKLWKEHTLLKEHQSEMEG